MSEVREKIIEYSSASLLQAEREKLTPTLLKKGEDKLRVNRRYTLLIEQENLIDQLVGEARFKRINQTSEGCLIPAGNQQKKKD